MGVWVVKAEWLEDSDKKNVYLPENGYGIKCLNNPIKGKKFFIHSLFHSESQAPAKLEYFHQLVTAVGQGEVADSLSNADYVIVHSNDKTEYSIPSLTWNEFLNLIIPEDPIPSTKRKLNDENSDQSTTRQVNTTITQKKKRKT